MAQARKQASKWIRHGAEQAITEPQTWDVTVRVPFDRAAWSKNGMWQNRRQGGKRLSDAARAARDGLALEVRQAIRRAGVTVVHAPMTVSALVVQQDLRGDSINAIDLVCDGIQRGTDLDDRWYRIGRWDYDLGSKPTLLVSISQIAEVDRKLCAECLRLLPWADFGRNASTRLSLAAKCKRCVRQARERVRAPGPSVTIGMRPLADGD